MKYTLHHYSLKEKEKKKGARAKAQWRIKHAQLNFRPISSVSEMVRRDKPVRPRVGYASPPPV